MGMQAAEMYEKIADILLKEVDADENDAWNTEYI